MSNINKKVLDEIEKIKKEHSNKLSKLIEERSTILRRYKNFLKDKK